jgi:putative membrane protein
VWNVSAIDDQQVAGLIMKVGGGLFIWTIMVYLFFKRFGAAGSNENSYRRVHPDPEPPLTYGEVTAAFERTDAPVEPRR